MPKVSVLMPTYDCAQYIGQDIQSILDQNFQDLEVIVFANASMDNTKEIAGCFKYLG